MAARRRTFAAGFALAAAIVGASPALGAINVSTTTDATALVNALLAEESGVTVVGTPTFTGGATSSGTFGGANFLPFNSGVVLTSGDATKIDGPNEGATASFSVNNDAPGYSKLDAIVAPRTTRNASVLKFSFIPTKNVISFQYVFGSEEYDEYVGSQYNDVFAFFLNGKNIALLPGTDTPVTIDNVNGGNGASNPPKNAQYYTDNTPGVLDTSIDGLVGAKAGKFLFATGEVQVGVENTIELAIADTSDSILDSAVFLKGQSFIAEPPPEPNPNPIPLPAAVWAGLSTLAGMGVWRRVRRA